jgi:hypothetical protein
MPNLVALLKPWQAYLEQQVKMALGTRTLTARCQSCLRLPPALECPGLDLMNEDVPTPATLDGLLGVTACEYALRSLGAISGHRLNTVRTAGNLGCSATASPRPTWFVMLERVCGIFVANSADCAGFADSSGL